MHSNKDGGEGDFESKEKMIELKMVICVWVVYVSLCVYFHVSDLIKGDWY